MAEAGLETTSGLFAIRRTYVLSRKEWYPFPVIYYDPLIPGQDAMCKTLIFEELVLALRPQGRMLHIGE